MADPAIARSDSDVEEMFCDGRMRIALYQNIMIRVGWSEAKAKEFELMHQLLSSLLAEYPDGVGLVLWIPYRAPIPDNACRTRAVKMFQELGPKIQGLSGIIEGRGFWASAARSVMSGLCLMSRMKFPYKILAEPVPASEWLAGQLQPRASIPDLTQAMQSAREGLNVDS